MTLILNLIFTNLGEVFIENLRQVWHASREPLPFRTSGSVPFWDFNILLLLIVDDFPKLAVIFSTFHETFCPDVIPALSSTCTMETCIKHQPHEPLGSVWIEVIDRQTK